MLSLTTNCSEATQTLKKIAKARLTIQTKVQQGCHTITEKNPSLNNKQPVSNSLKTAVKEGTTYKVPTEKVTAIRARTLTTYQLLKEQL